MEAEEVVKKAASGSLNCPKCGSTKMSLQNVRVTVAEGKPKLDPNTYGLCKDCGAKYSVEKLQKILNRGDKSWWQFWK